MLKTLGDNVKSARNMRGLSMLQLASMANISSSIIYDIEVKKNRNLSTKTLCKLSDALGVTPEYLLNYKSISNVSQSLDDILDKRLCIDGVEISDVEKKLLKNSLNHAITTIRLLRNTKSNN